MHFRIYPEDSAYLLTKPLNFLTMYVAIAASTTTRTRIMLAAKVEFSALKPKNMMKKMKFERIAKYEALTHFLDS
jgi:hypothetical protein